MKITVFALMFILVISSSITAIAEAPAKIIFNFEEEDHGWAVPDWAREKSDHVAQSIEITSDKASNGDKAIELLCDFPGDEWSAASIDYVYEDGVDLSGYKSISVDIFLPKKAKSELFGGRIILVVGPWWWIEMSKAVPLKHGKWTRIKAKLNVNEENERSYWKRKSKDASLLKHITDIRKIVVRIEYNANPAQGGQPYKGPIYIDNVVIK